MPDYRRTEELFKAEEILHLYKKSPGQLDDELFLAKVINPETNTFYQPSVLPLEYRKNLQQNKTYPLREVYQIYRIKRLDGTEWLKSRGRIVGLDRLGNEVGHSFTDPELYYKPQTQYAMRDKDSNDSSKGKERKCIAAGINEASAQYRDYTLPFNTKNFEQLFKQRPGQSPATVSLAIYEEGSSEKPRQITDPEKFKSTPFDDLWNEATIIKVKLDRSIKDQQQDRQYG
jgi:hypothetical protein